MVFLGQLFSTLVCLTLMAEIIVCNVSPDNVSSILDYYIGMYGEGYGTKWIYFPDGDGTSHNVSLVEDNADAVRGLFSELEFKLYISGNNSEDAIVMNLPGSANLSAREFDIGDRPIKIITHGWKSSVDSQAVTAIKDAYLEHRDVNVITVDWSYTADSIFYHWVANQTKMIGLEVATFLSELSEKYNIDGDRYHLIGHSLGAHIMGIAADNSGLTVDRITGLDPARPLFENPGRNNSEKLDSSDAVFVDVIHTCGGVLGIEGSIGTADFYPNSGIPPQPGCDSIPKILEACSHGRSYYYFAESIINPNAFPAYQCGTWRDYLEKRCVEYGFMGDIVNRNNNGNFYLKTNPKRPFGRSN